MTKPKTVTAEERARRLVNVEELHSPRRWAIYVQDHRGDPIFADDSCSSGQLARGVAYKAIRAIAREIRAAVAADRSARKKQRGK
jgi:hypothetical protein